MCFKTQAKATDPIMLPTFMGIGAPKAGTTWLYHCLREHPDIFMTSVKETRFFDYGTIDGRMAEYHAHFAGSGRYAVRGEFSTRYLTSCRAPQRIQHHLPDIRLIVAVRNPVEQVYSHYWHLVRQNFHQWHHDCLPHSFEAALKQYPEALLEPASYDKHLQRWQQYFDASQLLILFYEDICRQPQDILQTVYSFLGAEPDVKPPSLQAHNSSVRRGASPRTAGLGQLYALLYGVWSRHIAYRCKQYLGTRTVARLQDRLKLRIWAEFVFMHPGYPSMQPDTRARLRAFFEPDIRGLSERTGRDLSHWQ
ncbi:MAG: hypothetical protein ETSY1_19365 [Candidatus Entotheonella factor]|uniref:Sulfotransferase domain-containing protein n=1 Tax=Entotheonella factor TaxID=1429438 RepID=W4LK02_ENTF1|nr:MAG: hypothetical protein ETSY1_19365 [Candidatus Entotheonella factor]